MKPTILIIEMLLLAVMVVPASANSTIYKNAGGLSYYWVPSNILLFHIDYPWDFILYGMALIGLYCVLKKLALVILNYYRKRVKGST
jgi:hypothetical protein